MDDLAYTYAGAVSTASGAEFHCPGQCCQPGIDGMTTTAVIPPPNIQVSRLVVVGLTDANIRSSINAA